jgi:DNA-binding SARP family transcriptional activator
VSGTINLKLNKLREAEQELSSAASDLRKCGAAQQEVNAHLALAQLYGKTGDPKKRDKHLERAFSLAQDRGFTYFALLTREELHELAGAAIDRDICVDYCQGLISGHRGTKAPLLSVHCMGGFKVFRDSKPIPDKQWKSKRAKTLVKMLAAQDNLAMLREQAMEALWTDEDPTRLKMTVNAMLHRARKVLEPSNKPGKDIFCIKNEGEVVALDREKVWTDVDQFLKHLENARRLKDSRKTDSALEEYEKAASLYKGDFLPEDQYCDWAATTRDRLRMRYLRSLDDAAGIADSSGDRAKALGFYERIFHADQSNEKACCWLMTRYASEGRRNEAVRTYERCERALSRDMDLEPEEQTKELYRSILGG